MIAAKSKYLVFGPKKILYILLVLVLIGFGVWVAARFSKIKDIQCSTQFGPCPDHYLARLDFLVGTSWYTLPKTDAVLPYLSSYVEVGDISLSRKFPRQLRVDVVLRRAVGVVNDLMVDETGVLFGVASDSALPKLVTENTYVIGNTLNTAEVKGILILGELSTTVPHRIEGTMVRTVLTTQVGDVQVVFDTENGQENWNEALQLILARSKIDGNAPRRVDLRFNNPIIQY